MAPGVQKTVADAVYDSLLEGGAVPRLAGCTLGKVATIEGGSLDVALSFETGPSVLYDAVVVPGGAEALDALLHDANALDFVRAQYRHCKPILMLGSEGKNFR